LEFKRSRRTARSLDGGRLLAAAPAATAIFECGQSINGVSMVEDAGETGGFAQRAVLRSKLRGITLVPDLAAFQFPNPESASLSRCHLNGNITCWYNGCATKR
jgi:hypothetical protein